MEEVGGGPGLQAYPHHSGEKVEEGILHWRAGMGQLEPNLQSCQGESWGWASQLSQLQRSPREGHVGPHRVLGALPHSQPGHGVGVPG